MNFIRYLLLGFICIIPTLHAENNSLKVGIDGFLPPFAMHGKNNQNYGFDVDMMNSLCKIMKRSCEFHTMKFAQLLPAVENRQVDVALSYITITPERSKRVNFSNPYLLSYSRFLTKSPASGVKPPFSLELLKNKNIGVVAGTIFADQIKKMGVRNPVIKEYNTTDLLLEGLGKNEVDFILVDNPAAIYWEANSSGKIYAIGPSFVYGYGVGIAVNLRDRNLLNAINEALAQYQNSSDFKKNYEKFIMQF
jgi:polar amino acid transport system substrate-binding protein